MRATLIRYRERKVCDDAAEHAAADQRLAVARDRPLMQLRRQARQASDAEHRDLEQRRRAEHQHRRRYVLGQRCGHARADDGADRGAGRDHAEQPLALLGAEQIDVHLPEHRDHEQIEDRHPDEKYPADPDRRRRVRPAQDRGEHQDVDGEEMIGDRNEPAAWQSRDEPGERQVQQQHAHQRGGEQPLQIIDAAGDAHLIADRPDDVIRRQDRENVEPAPADDGDFRRPDIDRPSQQPIESTAALDRLVWCAAAQDRLTSGSRRAV